MGAHRGVYLGLVLAFLAMMLAKPSYADYDGRYCASRGYIAFELRSFHTPGLNAPHVLRVARFEAGRGIYLAGEVAMKDFEVHAMQCADDHVVISGFNHGYVSYTVGLTAGTPQIRNFVEDARGKHDPSQQGPAPGELELFRKPGVIVLDSPDPAHTYELVLSRSAPRKIKNGFETDTQAELVQIDGNGKISQSFLLVADKQVEYPD